MLSLCILHTEGLLIEHASLGCYVSVDGKLYDVITPLNADNEDNEIELPLEGEIRLFVKTMGGTDDLAASVSFQVNLLPVAGLQ